MYTFMRDSIAPERGGKRREAVEVAGEKRESGESRSLLVVDDDPSRGEEILRVRYFGPCSEIAAVWYRYRSSGIDTRRARRESARFGPLKRIERRREKASRRSDNVSCVDRCAASQK